MHVGNLKLIEINPWPTFFSHSDRPSKHPHKTTDKITVLYFLFVTMH